MLIPLNTDRHRFIPACAGNSCLKTLFVRASTVHPRLRGELIPPKSTPKKWPGSSPLARGTLKFLGLNFMMCRFIPACAGNSHSAVFETGGTTVHPRLRGELAVCACTCGLSQRFIPACAGNSLSPSSISSKGTVHPRLRGELV